MVIGILALSTDIKSFCFILVTSRCSEEAQAAGLCHPSDSEHANDRANSHRATTTAAIVLGAILTLVVIATCLLLLVLCRRSVYYKFIS